MTYGGGTQDDPWKLKTPSLSSEFEAGRDETAEPPALVVQVGATRLSYQLRALHDLRKMLKKHGAHNNRIRAKWRLSTPRGAPRNQ